MTVFTTGIGSLPFSSMSEALDHVFENYDIPFFPQLPGLISKNFYSTSPFVKSDTLVPAMAKEVLPQTVLDLIANGRLPEALLFLRDFSQNKSAIEELLQEREGFTEFKKMSRTSSRLKMQVIGPLTLASILGPLLDQQTWGERKALEELCWNFIWETSAVFVDHLCVQPVDNARKIFIFWDDLHLLDALNDHTVMQRMEILSSRFAAKGVTWAVHSCAIWSPPAVLPRLSQCGLATDFTLINPLSYGLHVLTFLKNKGFFAAGVIDTTKNTVDVSIARLLMREVLCCGSSPLLITAGCGTGGKSVEFEKLLVGALRMLAKGG